MQRIVRLLAPLAARTALVEATPSARSAATGSRGRGITPQAARRRPSAPIRAALAPLAA
jgi:hypothetical protein